MTMTGSKDEAFKGLSLQLTFISSDGHHATIKPKFFDTGLTLKEVQPVAEEMAALSHLFVKPTENGDIVQLYTQFQRAKYVKTVEQIIQ